MGLLPISPGGWRAVDLPRLHAVELLHPTSRGGLRFRERPSNRLRTRRPSAARDARADGRAGGRATRRHGSTSVRASFPRRCARRARHSSVACRRGLVLRDVFPIPSVAFARRDLPAVVGPCRCRCGSLPADLNSPAGLPSVDGDLASSMGSPSRRREDLSSCARRGEDRQGRLSSCGEQHHRGALDGFAQLDGLGFPFTRLWRVRLRHRN